MPAGTALPAIDAFRIAKIYAALADSPWADAADREAVAAHPGAKAARERIRAARRYHSAAAARAVTGGVRSLVFAASGLPADPEPHTAAAAACPDARFCYAAADEDVTAISAALLGGEHVTACAASLRDPEGLLSRPEVRDLPGPLHLQMQMAAHFWPPALARSLIRDYGRLLPAGSELLVTWMLTSGTGAGRQLAAAASRITGTRLCRHPAGTVAAWLDDAGLRVLPPGPCDVRGPAPAWAQRERARAPGRVMGAVARLR